MVKAMILAGLMVGLVVGVAVPGSAQVGDIRALELAHFERVTSLRSQIAVGWTPAQVLAIMGEPDRRQSSLDGLELVEIWGYRGFEVAIEFRNGLVANWFFRFMR